jgi:predicted enzyme related to lactoylglutathione lyase
MRKAESSIAHLEDRSPAPQAKEPFVDYKLELIVMPVADMDRAKAFYSEQVGFHVDIDHRGGGDFRVIQLTPAGSACSITLMRTPERAGTVQGLHLVVQDIEAARADLASRIVEISEPFHFGQKGQTPGLDPDRRSHGSFASFTDPDGNGWTVQEVKR